MSDEIDYKFNEGNILDEVRTYINKTYQQHYSIGKFQTSEFILDLGWGIAFFLGNVIKYAQRVGKKGSPEDHRKDLLKTIHYAILALHAHDEQHKESSVEDFETASQDQLYFKTSYIPTTTKGRHFLSE